MPVHNQFAMIAVVFQELAPDPEQIIFHLIRQWHARFDTSMSEEQVFCFMVYWKGLYKMQMTFRHPLECSRVDG
jgi:hypothetical protein